MRRLVYISLAMVLGFSACTERRIAAWEASLTDDFETVSEIAELTEGESAIWKYYQQTDDRNQLSIDTINPHSGLQCLKFTAEPSLNGASKSAIAHNRLIFRAEETVLFSAWFYIVGTADLDYIFLVDLEEDIAIGAGPGIRIALEDSAGYIVLERNKFLEKTLYQEANNKVAFPRDEWVEIKMEVFLAQGDEGSIKIWQNDQLLIDVDNTPTLPSDKLTVLQGTHNFYHSLQLGITANSAANDCVMYLDDVTIKVIP